MAKGGEKQIVPRRGGLSGKLAPGTGAVNPVTKAPLGRDVCFRDILWVAFSRAGPPRCGVF